jgi:hypothetical protein
MSDPEQDIKVSQYRLPSMLRVLVHVTHTPIDDRTKHSNTVLACIIRHVRHYVVNISS